MSKTLCDCGWVFCNSGFLRGWKISESRKFQNEINFSGAQNSKLFTFENGKFEQKYLWLKTTSGLDSNRDRNIFPRRILEVLKRFDCTDLWRFFCMLCHAFESKDYVNNMKIAPLYCSCFENLWFKLAPVIFSISWRNFSWEARKIVLQGWISLHTQNVKYDMKPCDKYKIPSYSSFSRKTVWI